MSNTTPRYYYWTPRRIPRLLISINLTLYKSSMDRATEIVSFTFLLVRTSIKHWTFLHPMPQNVSSQEGKVLSVLCATLVSVPGYMMGA